MTARDHFTRYHFSFRLSGMGETHYTVFDRETHTERTIRVSWGSDVARLLCESMPTDLLDAFNAWRRTKRAEDVEHITRRYGADEAAKLKPFVDYRAA